MVEVSIVLVIGVDEDGLLPDLGIFGEDVDDFRDPPPSEPGCSGMVRELLRWRQPRNGGQLPTLYILAELIKNVALRNLHLDLLAIVIELKLFQAVIVLDGHVRHESSLLQLRVTGLAAVDTEHLQNVAAEVRE